MSVILFIVCFTIILAIMFPLIVNQSQDRYKVSTVVGLLFYTLITVQVSLFAVIQAKVPECTPLLKENQRCVIVAIPKDIQESK